MSSWHSVNGPGRSLAPTPSTSTPKADVTRPQQNELEARRSMSEPHGLVELENKITTLGKTVREMDNRNRNGSRQREEDARLHAERTTLTNSFQAKIDQLAKQHLEEKEALLSTLHAERMALMNSFQTKIEQIDRTTGQQFGQTMNRVETLGREVNGNTKSNQNTVQDLKELRDRHDKIEQSSSERDIQQRVDLIGARHIATLTGFVDRISALETHRKSDETKTKVRYLHERMTKVEEKQGSGATVSNAVSTLAEQIAVSNVSKEQKADIELLAQRVAKLEECPNEPERMVAQDALDEKLQIQLREKCNNLEKRLQQHCDHNDAQLQEHCSNLDGRLQEADQIWRNVRNKQAAFEATVSSLEGRVQDFLSLQQSMSERVGKNCEELTRVQTTSAESRNQLADNLSKLQDEVRSLRDQVQRVSDDSKCDSQGILSQAQMSDSNQKMRCQILEEAVTELKADMRTARGSQPVERTAAPSLADAVRHLQRRLEDEEPSSAAIREISRLCSMTMERRPSSLLEPGPSQVVRSSGVPAVVSGDQSDDIGAQDVYVTPPNDEDEMELQHEDRRSGVGAAPYRHGKRARLNNGQAQGRDVLTTAFDDHGEEQDNSPVNGVISQDGESDTGQRIEARQTVPHTVPTESLANQLDANGTGDQAVTPARESSASAQAVVDDRHKRSKPGSAAEGEPSTPRVLARKNRGTNSRHKSHGMLTGVEFLKEMRKGIGNKRYTYTQGENL